MTAEDLKQIADLIPTLAKYPNNFQAKSLLNQVQRILNNNSNNRFKKVANANGGILAKNEAPSQSQIIGEKRVSLLEAKEIRNEIDNINDDYVENNVLATSEDKPKKYRRTNKPNTDDSI